MTKIYKFEDEFKILQVAAMDVLVSSPTHRLPSPQFLF